MPGTILCVDSDRSLCEIIAKALSGEGHRVLSAHDGERALDLLDSEEFDLVFLDLILPRRDGFAVLEALRSRETPVSETPVVLLSGFSPTADSRDRAAELRASALIAKPVPLTEFSALVREHLGKRRVEAGSSQAAVSREGVDVSGSFNTLPFPALIHHLHGLRAEGVLHVAEGVKRKWIHFRDGHPVAVCSNLLEECLGHYLVRIGRIDPEVAEESARRREQGKLQGEILVAMEVLSEEELSVALRAQADEKLFEIFTWDTGTFVFEFGAHLQRANAFGVVRSPANLILKGVRKYFPIERIRAYFDTHRDRFFARGESPYYRFQEIALGPKQEALVQGLEHPRRLGEFEGDEDVQRSLYALLATGLMELREAEPAPAASRSSAESAELVALVAPDEDARRADLAGLVERFRNQSPFAILGVDAEASADDVEAAYERLARRTHPDAYVGEGDSIEKLAALAFGQVTRAYESLIAPRSRVQREAELLEEGRQILNAENTFQRGEQAFLSGDYRRALQCFEDAIDLSPGDGEYRAYYGWTLHLCAPTDERRLDEAVEHLSRALELAGDREKPYLFMGRLLLASGKTVEAQSMFARAIQIQPRCSEALHELRLSTERQQGGGAR